MTARTPDRSRLGRRRQLGFSLIELMITILLALLIVAGLAAVYLGVKTSFVAQDNLAQLHDSERVVLTMLRTTLQTAGYYPDPQNETLATALPAGSSANADGTTFAAGQLISGTSAASATGSDTINVRYMTAGGDGLMNCLGGTSTTRATWVNTYAVDAAQELTCSVNGATPVPLVSNVASMTVLYGVDTGSGATDSYLTAAQVSANSLWGSVYTVQITITFLNPLVTSGTPTPMPAPWVQMVNIMSKS